MITEDEARAFVTTGVDWLDLKLPGWWRVGRINLDTLNMSSGMDCVIAQLHGNSYAVGIESIFEGIGGYSYKRAVAYGYDAYDHSEYQMLTRIWKELIISRRKEEENTMNETSLPVAPTNAYYVNFTMAGVVLNVEVSGEQLTGLTTAILAGGHTLESISKI
jgi:hypothetical protein